MSITIASKPKRRDAVVTELLPDGTGLLFDPDTGVAYAISETAARIWALCNGASEVAAILDDLASRYAVDRRTLESDSLRLLAEFAERRLLEESAS